MKAIVLAAGRGERMRPLSDTVPKPLLEVGGRPLIEYHLRALVAAGIVDIVVNLAWLGARIRAHLGDGRRYGARICYSDEGSTALDTGGGVFRALPLLGDAPFWVVNGDVYADYAFPAVDLASDTLGHLLLVPNPEHNPAGDFALTGTRVENEGAAMLTYSGMAVLRPELFQDCRDGIFPLAPLLRAAADAGRLCGERLDGTWHDVGTPERLAALNQSRADSPS